MGELIREALTLMLQISAEQIAQGKNPLYWIAAWAEMAEENGEL